MVNLNSKQFASVIMQMALAISASAYGDRDVGHAAFEEEDVLALMRKVNQYTQTHPYRKTDRNWIRATWYTGVMEAYHATGDREYLDQALQWARRHEWQVGHEKSGFNRLFCAMTWAELYLLDPVPEKIAPTVKALKEDVPYSPAGAEVWYGHAPGPWDGPVYADSLYAAPVLAMLHRATGDQRYLDILHHAFWDVTDKIFDDDDDLYYRDPSYIGKTSPNGRKILWSRGNGWVFGAIPRIIKHLPKDDSYYDRYVSLYWDMARSLASRQGDDGFWRSNLGDARHYTMPESSGTAFFTAGFAWGVREGILDRETYLPVVIRGWHALVSAVDEEGRLGWVQPVDAQPRPSHPKSTQEYAVGPFLTAAGQVCLLVRDGIITPREVREASPTSNDMLPPAALDTAPLTDKDHPLSSQIGAFMAHQSGRVLAPTLLMKTDYLGVIAGQVAAVHRHQNAEGRVIDPVEKAEKYFTTPCYAHSVAVLAKASYPIAPETIESGMKALDVSLSDMVAAKAPRSHGDFFTWPIVLACDLFGESASDERRATWARQLAEISPARAYSQYRKPLAPSDHRGFYGLFSSGFANNWNVVNVAGEWARLQHGTGDPWYVDYCLTMQLANFTPHGMYNESGNPLPYDLFARHYVTGMLRRGYRSGLYTTYRNLLWRGAWTSLFMQSPFGELPTGYRSSQHIWNEAEQAVIFEIYASAYARTGKPAEAGAFKRAAHLALRSIKNWTRPDGSGYVVKNRFPVEKRYGYESYSVHTAYNMLAMSMLAQAWQFADDAIDERPCPADVGGFVFTLPTFHKLFANVAGTYLEYDTSGDQVYNPTGLLRVHFEEGNPQLGPSDGCAAKYSGAGQLFAVGPAWQDATGNWTRLAGMTGQTPTIEILDVGPGLVRFAVSYGIEPGIAGTRVPVTDENTVALDGTARWFSIDSAEAGRWRRLSLNNQTIYQIMALSGPTSGCDLKTTISGLVPGRQYEIGVLNGVREQEGWQVLCGLTPERADAVLSRGMASRTAHVVRRSAYHSLVHEGQKLIGKATARAHGTINVYTFVPDDVAGNRRCWLAGFTYAPAPLESAPKPPVDEPHRVREVFTIKPNEVLIENAIEGAALSHLRVYYPMLVADGQDDTDIQMDRDSLRLMLGGKGVCLEVLGPSTTGLVRSGQRLNHRNGVVEPVYWDARGASTRYRLTPVSR